MNRRRSLMLPALLVLAACSADRTDTAVQAPPIDPADLLLELPPDSEHVGADTCAACHAEEHAAWRGSHHDLAMQEARPDTVLGDFDDARFTYAGTTSEFFRRGERFFVSTDGPDGEVGEFEISYTFGVNPLQQYLIELPGGRLQALGIAWDSRQLNEGGQRWFHLYPDESVTANHPLHWTGREQNWNYMCADCHSTGLEKRYDPESDTYDTHWSEIDVACESCHGPGRDHADWAVHGRVNDDPALAVTFHERRGVHWLPDTDTGIARRSETRDSRIEIDTCGRCHARASRLRGDLVHGSSLLESQRPALLDGNQFHPDGQMLGEVFNWASFLQSPMAQAGVTCSDCHRPHSQELRANGNAVCAQCHQPERFDQSEHTHHEDDSEGSQCTSCHMPQVTFMQVDNRHDHAFRIPRPDLTRSLGVPNACNDCHEDRSADWAARTLADWFPKDNDSADRRGDAARALHGAPEGRPGVRGELAEVFTDPEQPAIVRASALRALGPWLTPDLHQQVASMLDDRDPLVRMTAAETLAGIEPATRARHLAGRLNDPVLAVRIEAAAALAGGGEGYLDEKQRQSFESALKDYIAALEFDADRPEASVRLGNLQARRGNAVAARSAYRRALEMDEETIEAWINLADLQRVQSGEGQVVETLLRGLDSAPDSAELQHALGLSLVRQRRMDEALAALERAAQHAPDNARYRYVLAVALYDLGQPKRSLSELERNLARHPFHRETLSTLAIQYARGGQRKKALELSKRLSELEPDSETARQLSDWLQGE